EAGLVRDLGAVPLECQHRSNLLRLWLGVTAAGRRIFRDLPGAGGDGAPTCRHLDVSLAPLSSRIRRRPDQDSGRSLLARSNLPRLPPRDPADAESAQLVLSPPAPPVAPGRGAGEPFCAARGADRPRLSATNLR